MRELHGQRTDVGAFEKARAQGAVHLGRTANDPLGKFLFVIHAEP